MYEQIVDEIVDKFYDEIIDFIYTTQPQWAKFITKSQAKDYLFHKSRNKLYVYKNNGQIAGVAFYQKVRDEIHFTSLAVNRKFNGIKVIREGLQKIIDKEKVSRVSWLTPEFNFKSFHLKKGV